MSVLIIDDDDGVRSSVGELLREEGWSVEAARDGAEALAWLRSHPAPSLILLDLAMPSMNGVEFRRQQLADPALAEIPVIVMSARPRARAEAAQLGADDCLAKPMHLEELLHVVQNRARTQRH